MTLSQETRAGEAVAAGRRPNWLWVGLAVAAFVAVALAITGLRSEPAFPFVAGPTGLAGKPTPAQAPYLAANHLWATVAMTAIGLIGVAAGIRLSLKGRTLLPLMVGLSAATIVFSEVFYDVIGGVYFPYSQTDPLGSTFTILGRTMPVWITAGWFGYGIFAVVTYLMLVKRPTTRTLWFALGLAAVGDVVFEEVLLSFDVYHYYGNQPLVLLFELPWWWIPCNSVGVILAAAIAYRFRSSLRGWKALCMLVVTPMSVTAVYGFIALPSWIAVNGDFPWLVTQTLGLATVTLGVFAFMGVLKFVLNRDPFDLDYQPTEDAEFLRVN